MESLGTGSGDQEISTGLKLTVTEEVGNVKVGH